MKERERERAESREQREKNYKTFVQYGNNEAHGEKIEYHNFVGSGNNWGGEA